MEVAIDNNIYKQASDYAQKQGLNLTARKSANKFGFPLVF